MSRGTQLTNQLIHLTEEEKQKVQADAASVVSADSITNELTVKE